MFYNKDITGQFVDKKKVMELWNHGTILKKNIEWSEQIRKYYTDYDMK